MLQLKVVDQTRYSVFADREYLIEVLPNGTADLYERAGVDEDHIRTSKRYNYVYNCVSFDKLLRYLYERSEC